MTVTEALPATAATGATLAAQRETRQDAKGEAFRLGPVSVARLDSWLNAAGIEDGPLWWTVDARGRVGAAALSAESIRTAVKRCAATVGLKGATGDSLRIGSAQSLMTGGATDIEIGRAGRWSDPRMVAHPIKDQAARRGAVTRIFHGRDTNGATP